MSQSGQRAFQITSISFYQLPFHLPKKRKRTKTAWRRWIAVHTLRLPMHWIDFLPSHSQWPNQLQSFVLSQLGLVEGHANTFGGRRFRGTWLSKPFLLLHLLFERKFGPINVNPFLLDLPLWGAFCCLACLAHDHFLFLYFSSLAPSLVESKKHTC
jgi:hypothetical protein